MSSAGSPIASTSRSTLSESDVELSSSESDCSVVFPSIANTPLRRKIHERLDRLNNGRGNKRSRQTLVLRKQRLVEESETESEGEGQVEGSRLDRVHRRGKLLSYSLVLCHWVSILIGVTSFHPADDLDHSTTVIDPGPGRSLLDGSPAVANLAWPAPLIPLSPKHHQSPTHHLPHPATFPSSPARPPTRPSPPIAASDLTSLDPVATLPDPFADAIPSPFLAAAACTTPVEGLALSCSSDTFSSDENEGDDGGAADGVDGETDATLAEQGIPNDLEPTQSEESTLALALERKEHGNGPESSTGSRPTTPTDFQTPNNTFDDLINLPPSPFLQSAVSVSRSQHPTSPEGLRPTHTSQGIEEPDALHIAPIAAGVQTGVELPSHDDELVADHSADETIEAEVTLSEEPVFESDEDDVGYAHVGEGGEAEKDSEEYYGEEEELEFDETTFREHHLLEGLADSDEADTAQEGGVQLHEDQKAESEEDNVRESGMNDDEEDVAGDEVARTDSATTLTPDDGVGHTIAGSIVQVAYEDEQAIEEPVDDETPDLDSTSRPISPARRVSAATREASPVRPPATAVDNLTASASTPRSAAPPASTTSATPEALAQSTSAATPSVRSQQPAHAAPAAKRQLAAGGFRPTRPLVKADSASRLSGLVAAPVKKAPEVVVLVPAPKAGTTRPRAAGGLGAPGVRTIKPPHVAGVAIGAAGTSRVPVTKAGVSARGLPTMVKRPATGTSSDGEGSIVKAPSSRPPSASSATSAGSASTSTKPTGTLIKPRVIARPVTAIGGAPTVKSTAPVSMAGRLATAPSMTTRRVITGTSGVRPAATGVVRPNAVPTSRPTTSSIARPGQALTGSTSRLGNSALNASTSSTSSTTSGLIRPRAALGSSRLAGPAAVVTVVQRVAERADEVIIEAAPPTPAPAPVQSQPLLPRPTVSSNVLPRTGNDNVLRSPRKVVPRQLVKTELENAAPTTRHRITPSSSAETTLVPGHRLNSSTSSLGGGRGQIFGPPSPSRVTAPESNSPHDHEVSAPPPVTALTAPAEAVVPEASGQVFTPAPAPAAPVLTPLPRPERMRKPKTVSVEEALVERPSSTEPQSAPLPPPARMRTVRSHITPGSPAPAVELSTPIGGPAPAPLPRLSRKAALLAAQAAAEAEAASRTPSPPPAPVRPAVPITPAPYLTADQLLALTQKHTRVNKAHFNKLDVETILMDTNRPPSPTSKIRKALAPGAEVGAALTKASTKEGREERAAKRRGALRSSLDGSQQGEDVSMDEPSVETAVPTGHFRAAGDEEEFRSPVRPAPKAKGKKKSSVSTAGSEGHKRQPKVLRWDKALVYEGPLPRQPEAGEVPIIKRIELGEFGNWCGSGGVGARPVAVHVTRLVYRDDE